MEEIDEQVSSCSGTWRKRSNLRKRLMLERENLIRFVISEIDKELRRCKCSTMTEKDLRPLYSFKSKMKRML